MSKPSTNGRAVSDAEPGRDRALPDWGTGPPRGTTRRALILVALVVPGIVLGGIVAVVVNPVRGVLVTGVYLVAVMTLIWGQGLRVSGWLSARRLKEGEQPRFENLARSLASDLGVASPSLWLISEGGPNAASFTSRGPAIAATRSLLDGYTRTELEAVVAHCILRFARGEVSTAMLANAAWPFGHLLAPRVGYEDDVQTAAITRFPPALSSAIEKAEPRSGRYSGLWFVATSPTHRPAAERIDALASL